MRATHYVCQFSRFQLKVILWNLLLRQRLGRLFKCVLLENVFVIIYLVHWYIHRSYVHRILSQCLFLSFWYVYRDSLANPRNLQSYGLCSDISASETLSILSPSFAVRFFINIFTVTELMYFPILLRKFTKVNTVIGWHFGFIISLMHSLGLGVIRRLIFSPSAFHNWVNLFQLFCQFYSSTF